MVYGHRESGYQAINNWYKNSIKKLINDKAKLENKAKAYVLLNLSIFNGQDWDEYELKRNWNLEEDPFEEFVVIRNGEELSADEIDDFDNYLLNLIPPELFELYFFDGEQIADFFLEESNGGRIKNAFLTICGYDTCKDFMNVMPTLNDRQLTNMCSIQRLRIKSNERSRGFLHSLTAISEWRKVDELFELAVSEMQKRKDI